MPFPKPSAAASSLALLAALATPDAPGLGREARASGETVAQDAESTAPPDDLIFVMRPLRPLTGAAAPAKKPATADKGAQPPASMPGEQQKPATPDMASAAGVAPEAPASPAATLDLPTVALDATIALDEWNAPSRAFDWESSRLQPGPPPPFLPPLDPAPAPAPETAATESPAESQTRIAALLAEGLVGPAEVRLADRATMWLPAGRVFIPLDAARTLAKEMGLDWRPGMQGFVTLADGALSWLAPVELLDEGHIDSGAIDPDKSLAAIGERLPSVNGRRAAAGQAPATIEGWLAPPAVDASRRLSACALVSTAGLNALDRFMNCEAYVLGRESAIKIGLIERAEMADSLKGEISALAGKIVFDHGKTYEEFDAATDRVAPFHAADLLLHEIGVKSLAPSEAASKAAAAGGALLGRLSIVAAVALFGAAAVVLCLKLLMRRFRAPKDGPIDPAPAGRRPRDFETPPPEGDAAPARSFRAPPALRAPFARGVAPEPAAPTAAGQAPDDALAARTARVSRSRSVAERRPQQEDARPPADDAEEPVSALRSVASRMRGDAEPPTAAVDPGRAFRRRSAGGAAPAYEESLDLDAAILGEESEADPALAGAARNVEKPSAVAKDEASQADVEDPLGLIEPGDAAASGRARQMRAERDRSGA